MEVRDLTEEVLGRIEEHVRETGKMPSLVSEEMEKQIKAERKELREAVANKIRQIVKESGRQAFQEELGLIRGIESGERWIDISFWGAYLMVWDARLEHYQKNEGEYKKEGINVCRTEQTYSYHACEVTEVEVTDMQGNILFTSTPVYGKMSAWDSAYAEMEKRGLTHYLHRGSLPVNTGAVPYEWMDVRSVVADQEKSDKRRREWLKEQEEDLP